MAKTIQPEPWERQPGESSKAYEAFCLYRDMGPGERSTRKVAKKLNKSLTQIGKWSSRWNWVERAAAWDDELDRQARLAQAKAIKEMNERHAKQARALQTKALQRLQKMNPEEMSPEQVRLYILEAAKLERLAMGEAENIIEERRKAEERHERSVADELITDTSFLGAIQQALAAAEAEADARSGAGPVGNGPHRGPTVEDTKDNSKGGRPAPEGSGS